MKVALSGGETLTSQRAVLLNALASVRAEHPEKLAWDPVDQVCDKDYCRQFAGGKPLFRNWDHLSYWGSLSLGQAFANFLKRETLRER